MSDFEARDTGLAEETSGGGFVFFLLLSVLVLLSVVMATYADGFFATIAIFFISFILGAIGWIIAAWVRRFTHPDVIFTQGLADTFFKRLFWLMGPQMIGIFLGATISTGYIVTEIGIPVERNQISNSPTGSPPASARATP